MKCIFIVFIIGLVLASCTSSHKKSNFELRPYSEKTLNNGLKLIFIEDPSLPYFTMKALIYSGARQDPMGQSGLASLTGDVLIKGTHKRTALEITDSLAQLGSDLDVSVSDDFTSISATGLSFHKDQLIEDFFEVLYQPAFKNSEINRIKQIYYSQLKKTVDDPGKFATLRFYSYIYGSHPYGQRTIGTKKDLKSIRQKDLIKYYRKHYVPNNTKVAIIGQFDEATKKKLVAKFSDWAKGSDKEPFLQNPPAVTGRQILLIDKKDIKQTEIRLGHPSINRNHSDYLTFRFINVVLSGSFSSRLLQEVRVKRGLTYSVSSSLDAGLDTGVFYVRTFTRNEKVGETIGTVYQTLEDLKTKGVTEKELKDAKAFLRGTFPRVLETAEKLANKLLILNFYGIDNSYLKNYIKNVNQVTLSEVNKAIQKYIQTEDIKVLVYGPAQKILPQLKPLGVIKEKSYTEYLH